MRLYPDDVPTRPCTTCGHAPQQHQPLLPCADCLERREHRPCVEYRTPGDSTLAWLLAQVQAAAHPDQDPQVWQVRLRQAHVPLDVPAVRWQIDLGRVLASYGILTTETQVTRHPYVALHGVSP